MINPYMNLHNTQAEQGLVSDLVDEMIQNFGVNVQYAAREMITRDQVFGESVISDFKDWILIEMFPSSMEQFNGDGDMFTKFGMEMTDSLTLEVSKRRFKNEFRTMNFDRPREGDVIWFPLGNSLWEIKKVKEDQEFFKLGKNYVYRLECKLYQNNMDQLPTDSDEMEQFNALTDIASDSLGRTLGFSPGNFSEESKYIAKGAPEPESLLQSNFNDPFGEGV